MTLTPSVQAKFHSLLDEYLEKLRHSVETESIQSFQKIIEENSKFNIYSLGLFYSAGGWEYICPTFSSEEGLAHAAKRHARHSPADEDSIKITLRWRCCDSPHHADEKLESMMPKTQSTLDEIHQFFDAVNPSYSRQILPELVESKDFHQLLVDAYEKVHATVVSGLQDALNEPVLRKFFDSQQCALILDAGEISQSDFLKNIKPLNSPETFSKVAIEIVESSEAQTHEDALWEIKKIEDAERPPSTDLKVEDFKGIIEGFSPEFITQRDAIFLDEPRGYTPSEDSFSEEQANRIDLMQLLKSSPHFDELDKLYGHFIGNQFKAEDLLPCIARELVVKLSKRLAHQFEDRTFRILLVVDRSALYHITFYCKRDDGYEFSAIEHRAGDGVYEVYEINGDNISLVSPSKAMH